MRNGPRCCICGKADKRTREDIERLEAQMVHKESATAGKAEKATNERLEAQKGA